MTDKAFGFFGDDELFGDAASVVEQINDYLQQGKTTQAKSLLTRRWRDLVPDLPLRFSVVLEKSSPRVVRAIVTSLKRGNQPPALSLQARSERHGGYFITAEDGKHLGALPERDAKFLRSLGEHAALYTPKLLEIRSGLIAIELVRPELRRCASCDSYHTGDNANCDDCRAKGRSDSPGKVESEIAPISFHEALDVLQTAEQEQDESE